MATRTLGRRSSRLAAVMAVIAALLVAMTTPTAAAPPTAAQWDQLGADIDGEAAGDEFGRFVAMSSDGDTVIISGREGGTRVYRWNGATSMWFQLGGDLPGGSVAMSSDGSTVISGGRVYRWNGATSMWVQVGGDLPSGYVAMSSDGGTVIIGEPHAGNAGQARVYRWNNTTSSWVQVGGDIDGEAANDRFGRSVAMSSDGSAVVIGAPYNDGSGTSAGHARVYQWNGTAWVQVGGDIDGEATHNRSAWSVAMSGDGNSVIIGARNADGTCSSAGHARVYRWNSTSSTWIQLGADIDGEAAHDGFGYSVAMSTEGNTVIIGGYLNDGTGHNAGHARVYQWNNATSRWAQVGGDFDGEAANDWSGYSVAMSSDGDTVVIGAPYNDGAGGQAGQARISQMTGPQEDAFWGQLGADIDGEAAHDGFGSAVAMSGDGDTVVIGAPRNADAGQARVHRWNDTTSNWGQVGSDLDGEAADDQFGHSAAISGDGDTVIIGAPYNDGSGTSAGHARVYQWNGTAWVQVGGDLDGEAGGDRSGWSVAMSSDGDTVVIGAPSNDGSGAQAGHARVYHWNGTAWVQVGDDLDGEAKADQSGWSVAMSGDGNTVIIGAHRNDGAGAQAGQARVYRWNGTTWVQVGGDIDGEAANDESGWSVAMSSDGDSVIIGARGNYGTCDSSGHARVYQRDNSTWVQVGGDIDGEAVGDWSGYSVAISDDGDSVIIGARRNDGSGTNAGHARVYQWNDATSTWVQVGGDIDGEAANDWSGYSVAMSSDGATVVIGAPFNDGTGAQAGQTRIFRLAGLPANTAPTAADDAATTDKGSAIALIDVLSNDTDQDAYDVLSVSAVDDTGTSGTVALLAGVISYDPAGQFDWLDVGDTATDTFTYTVSDGYGGSDTATVTITISAGFWVQLGADVDGEATGDWSGYSVAMSGDGNAVIIGAPWNDGTRSNAGHARVYRWDGTAWVQVGGDIDGEAAYDQSGCAVAMSGDGDTVIIGARRNDGTGRNAGHARVYRWDDSAWVQVGDDIDGEAAVDQSGFAVAMSSDGNTVIIGARRNDGNGSNAGHARVYQWDGTAWVQVGNDMDGEAAVDQSGFAVAMSGDGDTVIIGAPFNDGNGTDAGHARVYRWNGTTWVQVGGDIDGEAAYDQSGWSVAMSSDGDAVIIGARFNDGRRPNAGHARVYQWNGTAWVQLGRDIDGETGADRSGYSVAMSGDGNTVVIGANGNDGTELGAGHARVFQWNGTAWVQVGDDIDGEAAYDQSGFAVAMSGDGNTVVVGARLNDGTGTGAGHARIYRLTAE